MRHVVMGEFPSGREGSTVAKTAEAHVCVTASHDPNRTNQRAPCLNPEVGFPWQLVVFNAASRTRGCSVSSVAFLSLINGN